MKNIFGFFGFFYIYMKLMQLNECKDLITSFLSLVAPDPKLSSDTMICFNKTILSQVTDRSYQCTANHRSNTAEDLSTFRVLTNIIFYESP